jgi:hypothetical protein
MGNQCGVRSDKFFRIRLLRSNTVEEIQAIVGEMKREQLELEDLVISVMWHMRGSLSREEAWTLSPQERIRYLKFIQERLKIVEKTKLPLI